MTIEFGVSPIAWINDDMPELGADTALRDVLRDISELGFAGVELGGRFPKDPADLRPLLGGFDLKLVGGWYSAALLTRTADEEIAALQPHLALLKAMGCRVFILAETSNAIHGDRTTPLGQRPRLAPDQWDAFGQRLSAVADHVAGHGLALAYHHHLGTVVEDADDLNAFIAATSDTVGLTLDTGHAVLGGIDPLAVIETWPERIRHFHCKDIRREVFAQVVARGDSFLDGVLAGMFTVPGDGEIDYGGLMRALRRQDYQGWVILEAEQDPAKADPRAYAELGLGTLKRQALASGLAPETGG
jgi:inosose dehydratase